jgi:hypothetical protein
MHFLHKLLLGELTPRAYVPSLDRRSGKSHFVIVSFRDTDFELDRHNFTTRTIHHHTSSLLAGGTCNYTMLLDFTSPHNHLAAAAAEATAIRMCVNARACAALSVLWKSSPQVCAKLAVKYGDVLAARTRSHPAYPRATQDKEDVPHLASRHPRSSRIHCYDAGVCPYPQPQPHVRSRT